MSKEYSAVVTLEVPLSELSALLDKYTPTSDPVIKAKNKLAATASSEKQEESAVAPPTSEIRTGKPVLTVDATLKPTTGKAWQYTAYVGHAKQDVVMRLPNGGRFNIPAQEVKIRSTVSVPADRDGNLTGRGWLYSYYQPPANGHSAG